MAVLDSAVFSGPSQIELRLVVDQVSPGTIRVRLRANPPAGNTWTFYNLNSTGTNAARYNVFVDGVGRAQNSVWNFDWRSPNQTQIVTLFDATYTFTKASVPISCSANGGVTNLGSASVSATASTGYVPPVTTYSVSYSANGGTGAPATQSGIQAGASFTVSSTVPTRSGYTFNYWNGSDGGIYFGGSTYTMPASNLTLSASWSLNPAPAPSTPSGFNFTNRGQTSIATSWNAASGANGYEVRRSSPTTSTWSDVGTSTTNTFSGLTANTAYAFQLRAYATNAEGTKTYSGTTTLNVSTLPATFTTPNVVGQNFNTAATNLRNAGFATVNQTPTTLGATSSNNLLVRIQAPTSGTTATVGDTASIEYYNFLIQVPNILGLTQAQATTVLTNAGFPNRAFTLTTTGATVANNLLVGTQTPTSGTQFNPTGTVTATVFNFLTPVPNVVTQLQDTAITNLRNLGFTNVTITLDENGATIDNVNTVKSQSPVNSATTYNPANQAVSLVVYSLGITGKRFTGTAFTPLTNAKRFTGTEWKPLTVQKRFNGTSWIDIAN